MKLSKINDQNIEKAVDEFEASIDCELIPVITNKSCYVDHISWIISLMLLILFIGLIDFFLQDSWASRTMYYVMAPIISTLLGHLLDKSDWVDRFFISKKERERQVMEKAQRIFFIKRNEVSKSGQAILLFVSVMERRIVIFPDPAMKIKGLAELQNKMLTIIQADFKNGDYEHGFLNAIQYLKTELAAEFPQTSKPGENQFSNKLIWWDV